MNAREVSKRESSRSLPFVPSQLAVDHDEIGPFGNLHGLLCGGDPDKKEEETAYYRSD